MDRQRQIDYWLDSAVHDLEAAESLYSAGKYDWCLFLGHLVLEKALKAAYVRKHEDVLPPRTHNLVRLIQETSIPADEEMLLWLDLVTDFHLEVRYPDYKNEFYKQCTQKFANSQLLKIKEFFSCIKSHLK